MKDLSPAQWSAAYEQFKELGLVNAAGLKAKGYRQTNPRVLWLQRLGAPAFQFKEDGKLIDVVAKVNQLLGIAGYGSHQIAFWWINPDPDSGKAPIDLINKPKILWQLAQRSKK